MCSSMRVMLKLKQKLFVLIGIGGINLAAVTVPFLASGDTQTSTTTVNLTINPVLISWSSGPTVTLGAITPDSTGRQSTNSDTVSANTNDTAGLNITMESNTATQAMTSGGNTIAAGSGSPASPATLTNNHWGWRIDSLAGFGAGPGAVLNSAAPSALTYAAVPAQGAPYTIKNTGTNGSTSSTVWYSARVDNTQPIGSYSATVLYTFNTN